MTVPKTASELAFALGRHRREGSGWRAPCPAHDDQRPSLSILESHGKILVTCRAGCAQSAVIEALRRRGLWSDTSTEHPGETVYPYLDREGVLRYQVVRKAGKKLFVQRRPDGVGGWHWNMQGIAPLPYLLPELIRAPADQPIFIVEGEKDCDALANRDLIATTNHGGAGKWRAEISQWFKGRSVIIIPDNDTAGRTHAADVAAKLAGIAATVRILDLPGLQPKGDVSDWLAAGGTRDELLRLAATAPLAEAATPPAAGDGADDLDDETEIARLANLKPFAYERQREAAAKRLGCRTSILDRMVRAARGDEGGSGNQGKAMQFDDPSPAGEPVDGCDLVAAIRALLKRHIGLPPGAGWTIATWCLHTFVFETGEHTPRLAIVSPERGCGKTSLLDLLGRLVYRPLSAASLTAAATFRVIDRDRPTLLIDEADAFLKDNEELRGILNAGHRYDGAVIRCVGEDMEPRRFDVFGPVAIALIGALPGTLADRSISIRMQRAGPDEAIEPIRQPTQEQATELVRRARRWADDHREKLGKAEPTLPTVMWNRIADNWRPLFAIAEACGSGLHDLLLDSAETLIAQNALDPQALGVMLLADIRTVFETLGPECDRIASATLVTSLKAIEERPWAGFGKRGDPLTPRRMADMLRPYAILSNSIRIGVETPKGYLRADFTKAWRRYVEAAWVRET
jgi:putative DNA primase/helicase